MNTNAKRASGTTLVPEAVNRSVIQQAQPIEPLPASQPETLPLATLKPVEPG